MQSFNELSAQFEQYFSTPLFPQQPANLYSAARHLPELGGKRVRPALCLMSNELFGPISSYTWPLAAAVEMFHNFTLVHDDIMDNAPLRRGNETVHTKFGLPTALLAGDVMLVHSYRLLEDIPSALLPGIIRVFNKTAIEVCEGQQMDMDFETSGVAVQLDDYIKMITLKTSVLLAASLKMGAIMGGAGPGNQQHLYEFGKNLGIAFQIQDDYLDAFGDPGKFGKQPGGDIIAGKQTFLTIRTQETATAAQKRKIGGLMQPGTDPQQRVAGMLQVYKDCGADTWALQLKQQFFDKCLENLDDVAVISARKKMLQQLAGSLMVRQS